MRGVVYGTDRFPICEECDSEMEIDMGEDDAGHQFQVSTCPNCAPWCAICEDTGWTDNHCRIPCTSCALQKVWLTCREHPSRPFQIAIRTDFLHDVFCTDCGYLRTYHPGDELEDWE
jgi:hypothetical protein